MSRGWLWLLAGTAALWLACAPAVPVPSGEGTIEVAPGTRLFFRAYGTGPDTAVVLHGGPGLHHGYLVPALAGLLPGRTLIFYDQRGRGRSTGVDTLTLSPDTDVADLEAVRVRFHLARMTVIAHHWGAAVAGLYAARHPDRVARVLMLSPFIVHPSFAYEFALLGARGTDRAGAAGAFQAVASAGDASAFCRRYPWWSFLPTPPDSPAVAFAGSGARCDLPDERIQGGEAVKRALLRSLGSWSWRERLQAVPTPVLVLEGHGPPVVEAAARRWAQHLPNARLLLVAGPHLYPWAGDPAGFAGAADRFLRGSWPEGSVKPPPFAVAVLPDAGVQAPRPVGTR